ncbi:hypothetical protein ACIQWR_39760 [Streptomyces sp. NPDC098789]|uniref:hypothetical protein n=1 Tax=Streptomyces sp. NPDC098789 TaxID=3366098 RepID=UPI0037F40493
MSAPWWSGGRLLAAALALTAAGTLATLAGLHHNTPAPTPAATTTQPVPRGQAHSSSAAPAPATTPPAPATAGPQASPSPDPGRRTDTPSPAARSARGELPPPESGPAADPIIQQTLDRSSTPNLPASDERALLDAGRAAWLVETSRYTRVRIQAVTARREPGPEGSAVRAVVRLVWAGADPAGTFLDGRPATLTYVQNGQQWTRA